LPLDLVVVGCAFRKLTWIYGYPYNLEMHSMMPHYVVSTLHCNYFEGEYILSSLCEFDSFGDKWFIHVHCHVVKFCFGCTYILFWNVNCLLGVLLAMLEMLSFVWWVSYLETNTTYGLMYFAHVNKKGIELAFSHHCYQGDFLVVIENNYVMIKNLSK